MFIAQIGTRGDTWQPVIQAMTCNATTVTYDRPGIGDSPPRPAPNPPLPYSVFADELAATLDEAGITEPVVLVGHSVGGLIAQVFADCWRDRTAGIVLVDTSLPRLDLWPPPEPSRDGDGRDATAFDVTAGEVEILGMDPPPVAAVVVTRTPGRWAVPLPHPAIDDLWTAHQRDLARRWRHAPLFQATDAGHQVPREAPALVAHAADGVVRCVRAGMNVYLPEVFERIPDGVDVRGRPRAETESGLGLPNLSGPASLQ